jgi:hypothetical protein
MFRRINGKVYGVLADFDLSSWTASLKGDYTKTSQQRTGTPPYMAHGLLNGADPLHMYRHDVESLFYIVLLISTRYEVRAPEGEEDGGLKTRQGLEVLPFDDWFHQQVFSTLASLKVNFLSKVSAKLDLSPSFEDFNGWLRELRIALFNGFNSRETHQILVQDGKRRRGAIEEFDDETLGGHISYAKLISSVRKLTGQLEGLVVRYIPGPPRKRSSKAKGKRKARA